MLQSTYKYINKSILNKKRVELQCNDSRIIDNREFAHEMKVSFKNNELTNRACFFIINMVNNFIQPFIYKDIETKLLMRDEVVFACISKWKKYSTQRNTPLQFFTQVMKFHLYNYWNLYIDRPYNKKEENIEYNEL